MRILLCSENVPPQVNGIARRVGHYASGLRELGHDVELLHPGCHEQVYCHANPWNCSSLMMILKPRHFVTLMTEKDEFDVVHIVLPLNISGIVLLAGFKVRRFLGRDTKPAIVASWHCNISDYIKTHSPKIIYPIARSLYRLFGSLLPHFCDRLLTPTKSSDPEIVGAWDSTHGIVRAGVCGTGVDLDQFDPSLKSSSWGSMWKERKHRFLKQSRCRSLILYVGRLSPEKSVDELLFAMPKLGGCALWVVGDGPQRLELEAIADRLMVKAQFWGYKHGEEMQSVYSVADVCVCPSLTETFGQTVNEALALECRVALPSVPVFVEAYSALVPDDAFWEPLDREGMARSIRLQVERQSKNDPKGKPERNKLMTWDGACEQLQSQYEMARRDVEDFPELRALNAWAILFLPIMPMLFANVALTVYFCIAVCLISRSFEKYKALPHRWTIHKQISW